MTRPLEVVGSRSRNDVFALVLVVVVAASAVWNLVAGDLVWAVVDAAVVAVAITPTLVAHDGSVLVSWDVLAVATAPVLARSVDVLVQPATYLSVAALALLVVAEIHTYSDAEMAPWFAVTFVVLTTMAVAGLVGVLQYYADVVLGTSFLSDRADLMWDLVAATGVGVGAGVAFQLYFREEGSGGVLSSEVRD